ncbi:MAG: hypothetical protein LBT23_11815 [Synergistaceae bacterium]|jgi:epoxyqueuosine reductase|nr:hypothetical protein [Synergistaceae bacterium]
MEQTEKARKIEEKALSLGFERCGIIKVEAMKGYDEKLARRVERFPEMSGAISFLRILANPTDKFPWGRSIVVCSLRYGVYRFPENLNGRIGKFYQCDMRHDENSNGYWAGVLLERYLRDDLGLMTTSAKESWATADRWAAMTAGLGVIRRNNFFYGDHGSYYVLSTFLIDEELELIHTPAVESCPDKCDLCAKSCPTCSLAGPYATNMLTCVSRLTTMERDNGTFEKHGHEIGGWIYGCDVCQDVCRFNRGELSGENDFPGLSELGEAISADKVLRMDYGYLRDVISPKFWYIGPDDVWKWKRNAINAILNDNDEHSEERIAAARDDEDERVRAFAKAALERFAQ